MITAVLKAGSEGASRLKVYFYGGDPDKGGRLLAVEPVSVNSNSEVNVRIPYHPASSGAYRVWAVVNKGKPYQTQGHTKTIVVQDPHCTHDCEHGLEDRNDDSE